MQKETNYAAVWSFLTLVAMVILVVGSFTWLAPAEPQEFPTASEIAAEMNTQAYPTVPTAEEIAAAVTGNLDLESLDNEILQDVLYSEYSDEVGFLEGDCIVDLQAEFSDADIEEMITDLLEIELGEKVRNVIITDKNYDDEYDFDVNELGLDDEEDRSAEITSTLRVSYKFEDGTSTKYWETVYSTASCDKWDKDDNKFDDLNVEFSLS